MTRVAILLAFASISASAQTVRVVDDRRAEIIGILFRIVGAPDYNNGNVQPYIRQVDSAFLPYRSHPVFAELNRLRRANHIALSDITTLAPQLTDPVTFGERSPLDTPSSTLAPSWHGADARPFLAEARDFAKVAHVAEFLHAHQDIYDSAAVRMKRLVDTRGHLDWLRTFFNEPSRDVLIVSPLLINGTGNFGASFHDGATLERYAFIGIPSSDNAGFPVLGEETLPILIHELNHSYVNHVLDSVSVELQPAGAQILPAVGTAMSTLAYQSAQAMFNESIVRAGVIRYLIDTDGPAAGRAELQLQRGLGFVWMEELVDLLGDYEANRATYPTFATFAPRIVWYYNRLAPRIERVVDAYENRRPHIVATSISNGAGDVDPGLTKLVLTFDKPVNLTNPLKGRFGSSIPELTGSTIDATRRVMTIGIIMEPGHDYSIPFGPAFLTDDGYPNQRLDLTFHTRAAP